MIYQSECRRLTHGTISGCLSAIRWVHLANGYGDPLQAKPRLSLMRRAIKRISGPVKAKLPVTPDMLRLIGESLDLSDPKSIVVWAGLVLAFFFLLRSSEYCEDPTKALRVGDVQFSCSGVSRAGGRGADEVLICIRDSKTDHGGQGALLTAYATGDMLCPVTVAAKVVEMRRGVGATDEDPLLVWSGNAILKRTMVTDVLC